MREVFAEHRPTVVFHAAAYKHVGLMEANPVEAVRNNAIATRVVAHVAGELGRRALRARLHRQGRRARDRDGRVEGARRVRAGGRHGPLPRAPRYAAVRFGNVLGSSGSVVPIFRRQIERGGPVTVTDERMTRYFMTIPEAVQLIIRSGSLASTDPRRRVVVQRRRTRRWTRARRWPGAAKVFVLDMGEPVRIVDLARAMIDLSGLDPDRDIDIEIVGARPGEKLHEELFNSYERARPDRGREDPAAPSASRWRSRRSSRCSPRSACSCSRATPPAWRRRSPSCPPSAASRRAPQQGEPRPAAPGARPRDGGPGRQRDAPAPLVHSPNS